MNGFRSCGIVPFNRDAISSEMYDPSLATETPRPKPSASLTTPPDATATTVQHAQEPPTFFPPSHDPSFSKSESQTSAVAESSQESFNAILPLESAASYNAILPLESDASTSMSLDDPDLLLSLINTGEIEVVASAGSPEACEIAPISSSSLNLSKVNETSVESLWNEAVESIFLPPTPAPQKPAKKSKAKTSHRILTATEVIEEKRELLELRKIKEEKARNKKSKK